MTYRIANSLDQLRNELNRCAPSRSKSCDGWIGDAAHAARESDHNPWVKDGATGIVTACDFTHDPAGGANMDNFVAQLLERRDPRIKYIIWNEKIWRSYARRDVAAWAPQRYTGQNRHTKHAHVSVSEKKTLYDLTTSWGITRMLKVEGTKSVAPPLQPEQEPSQPARPATALTVEAYRDGMTLGARTLKEGLAGSDVKWLQAKLGVRADGLFGPITDDSVHEWQRAHGLVADGLVGPLTWKALLSGQSRFASSTPSAGTKPRPLAQVHPPAAATPGAVAGKYFTRSGRQFPSRDGYPLFAQGYNSATGKDETWGGIVIASKSGKNVRQIGCAMTAVTMAVSGITGQLYTPADMAQFLLKNHGFGSGGDILDWDRLGRIAKPEVDLKRLTGFKAPEIDRELAAGRPVVVHVDYYTRNGGKSQDKYDGRGDHWVLITSRTANNHYQASDPAGGKFFTLHAMKDGRLEGDDPTKRGTRYRTVGNAVTFSRGLDRARWMADLVKATVSVASLAGQPKPKPKVVAPVARQPAPSTVRPATSKVSLPSFHGADKWGTVRAIREECIRQGVKLPTQIAYVLATVEHETGDTFKPIEEASYMTKKEADAYLRGKKYHPYHGRGYVQLTWKSNYQKYSDILGLDLVRHPELLLQPDVSLFILVHGMKTGAFTSKKLSDYLTASHANLHDAFRRARAIINGTDRASAIADLAMAWMKSNELKRVA
ncbi:peptidoglycan-binding protein [Corallococcus sp. AB011P]|uniref:peptidoglycan-binding protein n=1 Tax=Corallococcus sp. AB011P TaxID=2316735 RepID=UPI0011C39BAD|nr:peptidoglycan-binding protein [Corallococcus sp. AB011P]